MDQQVYYTWRERACVYGPAQARRVISRGKLAVVIGAEWSNPFGCDGDWALRAAAARTWTAESPGFTGSGFAASSSRSTDAPRA